MLIRSDQCHLLIPGIEGICRCPWGQIVCVCVCVCVFVCVCDGFPRPAEAREVALTCEIRHVCVSADRIMFSLGNMELN